MLSEKKMVIGQSSIDFLGVNISYGKYTLQPHIATSLSEFPDKLTSGQADTTVPWNYKLHVRLHSKSLQIQELFGSIVEEISSRMELCSHRSSPTIEKVIRKASSFIDSRTR